MSDEARQLLRELLAEALGGNGNGHASPPGPGAPSGAATPLGPGGLSGTTSPPAAAPQVPAPPVAAVLRPSTWSAPAAPGEVVGSAGPPAAAPSPADPRVESVRLSTDDDLARFAAHVLAHADAVRSGALRFTFGPATTGIMRVDRGAVTERAVNEAAKAGGRLILGPRAVLTPLARERARALKIQIERER